MPPDGTARHGVSSASIGHAVPIQPLSATRSGASVASLTTRSVTKVAGGSTTSSTTIAGHRGDGTWSTGATSGTVRTGPACPACAAEVARAFDAGGVARSSVTSPDRAAQLAIPVLGTRDREACVAILLDTKHRVLDLVLVSIGSIDHTFMAPRETYRSALLANASALVVAHNHPSGDATPSRDDIAVTARLVRAGELLGVRLLDHLVVAGTRWESLARGGHV